MDSGLPEGLINIDVAQTRQKTLIKQQRLDASPPVRQGRRKLGHRELLSLIHICGRSSRRVHSHRGDLAQRLPRYQVGLYGAGGPAHYSGLAEGTPGVTRDYLIELCHLEREPSIA